MQRIPTTIEEQLILKSIKEECPWDNLPKRLQSTLSNKDEWHRRVIDHCIRKRLQWNICFARKVCKEGEYYEDMMRYLRKNLALFPYHLAEYVCRVMRLSPFRYYCDMIFEVMKNEQPYDSIPNFSAADALRLTGIGRNEFIDIMNKCRSKKIMWKLNKSIAKELLPTQPADFTIEPWWGVCLVNFTLEEFKKLTEEEMATIDKICKEEANAFVLFDPNVVRGLHRRGLVYFDVPVYPDDRFKVSRLEGFVSNREQSYEDPIEELLYAVFVVSSENSTVAELAATLQADLSQLQAAASFSCRLGWAVKLIDPESILQDSAIPGSPSSILSDDEDVSNASTSSSQQVHSKKKDDRLQSGIAHVAFVVDANITSYLMMGSLSPGLKAHAVTLYEAGKLGDSSIAELCKDLSTLEGKKFEGELQEFANHAYSLRCILECLQSGGVATNEIVDKVSDQIERQGSLDGVTSLVAGTSISEEFSGSEESKAQASFNDELSDNVNAELPEINSFPDEQDGGTSTALKSFSTITDENSILVRNDDLILEQSTTPLDGPTGERGILKKRRKYRVDILRCESLAALAPATLERLFLRDYDIIVSMVPLPSSSVIPGPKGPIHFGPPSYSSMTPWMKLVLYMATGNGPLSVVLMKGQCLRLLPAPLMGCEKALIWSWDGSVVGGLGGKFEGNLVNGSVLLHCLNSILKYSAVLVQPLSRYDLNESGGIATMDIALPLKNFDGSDADLFLLSPNTEPISTTKTHEPNTAPTPLNLCLTAGEPSPNPKPTLRRPGRCSDDRARTLSPVPPQPATLLAAPSPFTRRPRRRPAAHLLIRRSPAPPRTSPTQAPHPAPPLTTSPPSPRCRPQHRAAQAPGHRLQPPAPPDAASSPSSVVVELHPAASSLTPCRQQRRPTQLPARPAARAPPHCPVVDHHCRCLKPRLRRRTGSTGARRFSAGVPCR